MEDALWAILWMAATGATVWSCWEAARKMFPEDSPAQQILHTGVFAVAICISSLTIVGSLGLLSPLAMLVAPLAASLALRRVPFSSSTVNKAGLEPAVAVWLWGLVSAVIVGHCIVNGILRFPTDFDCLMYHLPVIDIWIQSGSFAAMESPRWSDSSNSEVLGLWFVGAFSGDFFVPLNNLPMMVVWVAALLETAKQLELSRLCSHTIAIASIAVYTTVHETDDASNDLMVVAFFVSGLAYAMRYQRSASVADLLLFGLSLGGLAGTKFFAAGYALLLGVVFAALSMRSRGFFAAVRDCFASIAISLAVGGYWYIRNYALTGHVFYPKGSAVFSERITHPDLAKTTLAFNGDPRVTELLLDAVWRLCGPIQFFTLLMLPTFAVLLSLSSLRNRRLDGTKDGHARLLLALLAGTTLLAVTVPMLVEDQPNTLNHLRWGYTPIRYSLCFLSVLMITAGFLLHACLKPFSSRVKTITISVLMVCSLVQFCWRFWDRRELDMNFAVAVGALSVAAAFLIVRLCRRSDAWRAWGLVLPFIAAPVLTAQVADRWHAGFAAHYNLFYGTLMFDQLHLSSDRILVLDERSYAFFGSRRQHYVLHEARFRDISELGDTVHRHSIDIVVTRIDSARDKISRYRPAWDALDAAPEFEAVGMGRELRFYRPVPVAIASDKCRGANDVGSSN